jgi:hypothetical protein
MATRFRKHRTRKMKGRKALKTRRHRGGNKLTDLFMGKKPLSGKAGPAAMGNTTLKNGIEGTGHFKGYTANAVGAEAESLQQFKNRMRGMKKSL